MLKQIWNDVKKAFKGFGLGGAKRSRKKKAGDKEPALGSLKPKLKVKMKAKPRRPKKAVAVSAKKKKVIGRKAKR